MKPKTVVLILLAVISLLIGAFAEYFAPGCDHSPSDLPCMLALAFLIFAWFRIDADQRSYERSIWFNICVVVFAILAMPYYFFSSRGVRDGFASSGVFLLVVLASISLTRLGHFTASALHGHSFEPDGCAAAQLRSDFLQPRWVSPRSNVALSETNAA